MAAPSMEETKMGKSERKLLKKRNRARLMLLKHDGIHTLDSVTRHLVVFNGGLDNNVSRSDLEEVFQPFGEIAEIVMQPQKSYAFVSYYATSSAQAAYVQLNGHQMMCPGGQLLSGVHLYLAFVGNVPGQHGKAVDYQSLPPGLVVLQNFVSEEYEARLLADIDWHSEDQNLKSESKQNLKHRRVKHFGYEFMYGINNVDLDRPLEKGIPKSCDQLIDKLLGDGIIEEKPDQLTINQYEPGQGIPPHVDTHSAFEDWIISLSLGSQVVMEFRHPDGHEIPVVLPRRSLIVMTGETRYVWTHGITPRKSDIVPIKYANACPKESISDCSIEPGEPLALAPTCDDDAERRLVASESHDPISGCVAGPAAAGQNVPQCCRNSSDVQSGTADGRDLITGASGITVREHYSEDQALIHNEKKRDESVEQNCKTDTGDNSGLTLVKRDTRTSFTFRKVLVGPCQCAFPAQCDSQQDSSNKPEEPKGNVPSSHKEAVDVEQQHVHKVYEEIARHFSETRHTPWPQVVKFLSSLPPGSLVADVGCGNGKYLSGNPHLYKMGCDRSFNLCAICEQRGLSAFVADCLILPIRQNSFDAAISIAVIHHLSTSERRLKAVQELVKIIRPGGKALIYVWALEQERNKKKSNYLQDSRIRDKHSLKVQEENQLQTKSAKNNTCISDVSENTCSCKATLGSEEQEYSKSKEQISPVESTKLVQSDKGSFNDQEMVSEEVSGGVESSLSRVEDPLQADSSSSDSPRQQGQPPDVSKIHNDKDLCPESTTTTPLPSSKGNINKEAVNHSGPMLETEGTATAPLTVHVNRTPFESKDLLVPWHLKGKQAAPGSHEPVFHRYYHVFEDGELEVLCGQVPGVQIVESYYDNGNWCVVLQKEPGD